MTVIKVSEMTVLNIWGVKYVNWASLNICICCLYRLIQLVIFILIAHLINIDVNVHEKQYIKRFSYFYTEKEAY